jgi:hypothetical protein
MASARNVSSGIALFAATAQRSNASGRRLLTTDAKPQLISKFVNAFSVNPQ